MAGKDLDDILTQWGVYSSSERWSLKSMFEFEHQHGYTENDFVRFLERKVGPSKSNPKNTNK